VFSKQFNHNLIEKTVSQSLLKSETEVKSCLTKTTFSSQDLSTLLSPHAENYLETLAQKSVSITRQRFGNTMQLFIPMYLSNECFNTCTYCGFSLEYKYKRKTLNTDEIKQEATLLSQKGFKHILLLTGESPKHVSTPYLKEALQIITPLFSSVGIEVQPLEQKEYQTLIKAGADKLTLYQETYHKKSYLKYHTFGLKRNFNNRLDAIEKGAKAGFYQINIGALLGLYDWRYEAFSLANHLDYLMKKYWKIKFAISFPRIQDMIGSFHEPYPINDKHLTQLITAFRLAYPDLGITLSTRESQTLRDNLAPLGITSMSAESNTSPAGYTKGHYEEQFQTNDNRPLKSIITMLKKKQLDPVTKDWDISLMPN
tara:strand:+ start:363 stop:1472 length:1110 start_codon:yes stop_codon:yes gene_type:complete